MAMPIGSAFVCTDLSYFDLWYDLIAERHAYRQTEGHGQIVRMRSSRRQRDRETDKQTQRKAVKDR